MASEPLGEGAWILTIVRVEGAFPILPPPSIIVNDEKTTEPKANEEVLFLTTAVVN